MPPRRMKVPQNRELPPPAEEPQPAPVPQAPIPEAPPSTKKQGKPKRKADGTYEKGTTGNPGGRPKSKEVRKLFMEEVPHAIRLVRKWRRSGKVEQEKAAVSVILNRALGKDVKPSDLPEIEEEAPQSGRPDSASGPTVTDLLSEVQQALAEGVAQFKRRQKAGELGLQELVLLGQLGSTLSTLAKEERSQKEDGEERNLAELASVVRWLEGLPAAERQAFFERIQKKAGSGEQAA